MLDTATRKRIDDCRDILVGKLPDPKAQIEQITIGLIYKFMDDMDKEAIELGGKAKFFSGAFKKYSWDNLFDTKVTASEMLKLYSDAIESMTKNPNIPQLFRDIFNNAYLPYRSPETLKLFLKTIGEFEYTHSEKLGDAFEYLLSVMGSQGDAGQFRTPRHIIDFLVAIVNPGKNDTIMDPACGTAGFLISAFKHIKEANKKGLTPDERKKLIKNFVGYDISPDMVRLSRVNLYLHGFSEPHIYEYDTLSSEDRWKESFDVVLANPPFMSPKGGIRPHKKFSISSNRSEVLFVDYIAEHLNPKGRAGIIVPEGVIFQSGTAYKDLRKMLVDNYLYAVVSLPAGVFNPYSGVKTSILLMDKELAKKGKEILFVKIDNDGYNLGSQRNAIKGGQLEEAIDTIAKFRISNEENKKFKNTELTHAVAKTEIGKSGDYNLSGERYKIGVAMSGSIPRKKVEEVCIINPLKSEIKETPTDTTVSFVPMADLQENSIHFEVNDLKALSDVYAGYTYFKDNDVLLAKVTPCFENGKAGVAKNLKNGIGFGSSEFYVLRATQDLIPEFLYRVITSDRFKGYAAPKMTGTGGLRRVPRNVLGEFEIPIPPITFQQQVVAEIDAYQKIIDGAKMVVENYKPKIEIHPEWEMVELDSAVEIINGYAFQSNDFNPDATVKCVKITNVGVGLFVHDNMSSLPKSYLNKFEQFAVKTGNILIALTRTIISSGLKVSLVPPNWDNSLLNQRVAALRDNGNSNLNFIYYYLRSPQAFNYIEEKARSLMQPNLSISDLKKLPVPLPPIEIQQLLVSQLEKEQSLVNANKELIEIFEQKIKEVINKVWQGKAMEYREKNEKLSMVVE